MTLRVDDIDRWDPEAVRVVFRSATSRAESAAAASARLAGLPAFATWGGVAAQAARDAIGRTRADLEAYAGAAFAVARAAAHAAEGVADLQADLRALEECARAGYLEIDRRTGTVVDPAGTPATAMAERLRGILAEADALDAALAHAINLAEGRLPVPRSPAPPAVPPSASGEEVNAWWVAQTDADRAALLAGDPGRYGNLDGIPVADRDRANRAVMDADLARVTDTAAANRAPLDDVVADPARYGLTEQEATRYTNAVRVVEGLERNAARTGANTVLLAYQPERFGGQGRAAIAIGDPDRAAQTAVLVPGAGSSVASGWLSATDAANLFNETSVAAGDQTACVVAWMGYDAPDGMNDPRIAGAAMARDGGALLAADVNALAITGQAGSHLTVIGHSYGSTTVADAAAGFGMHAADVVLLGSPGTDMARTATDFHLPPGGHVYVGAAASDPITNLSGLLGVGLGADPAADGFGSTRFKAEVPGFTWQPWSDHDHYFDSGSESLFSIADIAAGDGAALQDHGMTAPHRRGLFGSVGTGLGLPSWSNPLEDPELTRPATSGHVHTPGSR